MDCARVRERLADYSVGLLGRRDHQALGQHLEACPPCRRELAIMAESVQLVRVHAPVEPPADLWDRGQQQLIAERIQQPARPPFGPSSFWSIFSGWGGRGLALAGVAAAVAAAIFFPRPGTDSLPPPVPPDREVAALVRQRAMTEAESPVGSGVVWEMQSTGRNTDDEASPISEGLRGDEGSSR